MKRPTFVALLALVLAACASTPTVQTDFDPAAQFSRYRTYTWREQPEAAPPLVKQRIVAAIDRQLQAKGWTRAAEGDVAIAAHVASREKQSIDTFYDSPMWSGWGWRHGWDVGIGYARTRVTTYTVGTLVVDMFDTSTRQAVWRGTAEGTVPDTPEKVNAAVEDAIARMFRDFPPGSAATAR